MLPEYVQTLERAMGSKQKRQCSLGKASQECDRLRVEQLLGIAEAVVAYRDK